MLALAALATTTPVAGALPYNDPYDNYTPTTTSPRADLTVSVRFQSVYHWQTGAWEGSKAVVTVKNEGERTAGSFYVRVRSEQRDELGWYMVRGLDHNVSSLSPGQSLTFESLYFRRYCWVELTATADAGKTVSESNEHNNVAFRELQRCKG
ncbi:MAG: CARDB domain-containing protein [Acidimicrobiia bacterium]